jgi:hypothetical protein
VATQQYTKEVEIPKEYWKFTKVFNEEESQRFPPRRTCDHAIDFKPGAPDAINCKVYPMTRVEDEVLDTFIDEPLEKGYIRPSKSQYASSFFFIKKKDGKLQPMQDYRKINAWTVHNQYPLPLIGDLIRNLSGTTIFTKFDIQQGYNNIQIKAGDKHKAAFKTRRGLFKPTVMYFGLCNSPATFQAFMNEIFHPVITKWALLESTWTTSQLPPKPSCLPPALTPLTLLQSQMFFKSPSITTSISSPRSASSMRRVSIT